MGGESRGSEAVTEGVRVVVRPHYLADRSAPEASEPEFAFAYQVEIVNERSDAVQLVRRHWTIVDADGERREVDGEGVVGERPRLEPGERFTYTSWCPIATTWGTMEGSYAMRLDDGTELSVSIARFYLVADPAPASA